MLMRKAVRKIIITSFSLFTIFLICIIPSKLNFNDSYLNPNIETILVTNMETSDIYLLGNNDYLVKTNIILNAGNLENKIKGIIEHLTINTDGKIPNGFFGIIPKNTVLRDIKIDNGIVTLNFSNDLLNTTFENERKVIEAITYSIINFDGVSGIKIKIDDELLKKLPQTKEKLPDVLNRNFGINKRYEISNLKNITSVVLYYVDDFNDNLYYVPVTKYLNDDREKINVIIDNLASNYIYEPSLMSLLASDTKLLNYEVENLSMKLDFSSDILHNDKLLEEVTYQIADSVFANYDVNKVVLKVDGKIETEIDRCCIRQK